jgi:thiol peroxidase
MTTERANAFVFAGHEVTLIGPELKPGNKAPNFEVIANDLSAVTLDNSKGKVRIFSVVPSLDTGVCDAQTRRFNEEAAKLGENVVVLTVSADLPFAQKRWCGAAGIDRVQTLSDHRTMSFGSAYGTYNKDFRLESRAVFVVDSSDTVVYSQYLPAAGEHPNYEAALEAAKAAK